MGPSDWRRLLADPRKQWVEAKSAYEAAVSWEAARRTPRGLPPSLAGVLDSNEHFRGSSLLLGLPEHQVALQGGGHASQTDFWALISAPIGVVSTAVEAKAGEPFDTTVRKWLAGAKPSSGKPDRLKQLCALLRITESDSMDCRYQLMHRPAAAILEAKRFRLNTALFIVQAFGANEDSFKDYETWAKLLGVVASDGALHEAGQYDGVTLWIGWVSSPAADHVTVRAAV
jgi:hypothetical protein